MVLDALDKFNARLKQNHSQWTLRDAQDTISNDYALYIARKNGEPKDDMPGLNLSTNAKRVGYERFCLACNSSAFKSTATAKPT
jgi:hypothetical protein